MAEKKLRVNQQIRVPKVRLIGEKGEQIGIVSIEEAQAAARENNQDLVEISPNEEPPVCRIMDYGKHVFERKKKLAASKKKQKQTQVKEVKMTPRTEEADYQVKMRNVIKFLKQGDKVKITIRFRGREMAYNELGVELMKRIEKDLAEDAIVEFQPKMEGRQLVMVVAPKR